MAKPIRSTPELRGQEAENFIKRMVCIERASISKKDKELVEDLKVNAKFFKVY